ncbi:MAG: DUF2244 domain-containing protein [Gammaproteobacteria bacterium]
MHRGTDLGHIVAPGVRADPLRQSKKMIYQSAADDTQRTFVIQPNRSMSWRGLLYAYIGIGAVTLGVGIWWFFAGLPLVLPFSGLEMLLLGAAFYLSSWRGGVREVITIDQSAVAIESGRTAPERRAEFHRQWTRVVLERHWNGWYPSRLLIRSHGRQVEVGQFLNEQERQGLAEQLGEALRGVSAHDPLADSSATHHRGIKHVG